ncbi:hypothetical protein LUZ60_015218 [Juncus effusus]|nr:hypothetical protein LUZ60_015218 [Juncus effusus]
MKLSFSISKSKTTTARPNPVSSEEPSAAVSTSTGPQFVTEFDPTKPLNSEQTLVIAPLSNSEYTKRFKPSSLPTEADDPTLQFSTETQFVLDTNNAADPSGLPYGLHIRSEKEKEENGEKEEKGRGRQRLERVDDLKRFKEDIHNLPEDRGQDEFLEVPVEGFGAAILRGYGWSEGKGIGPNKNKEDTKIVELQRRGGQYGLGFNPSASDPKKKRGGEWTLPVDNGKNNQTESKDLERERRARSRREERDDSSRRNGKDVERERERDGNRRNEKAVERERSSNRRKEEERERESRERERVSSSNGSKRETKQVRWLTSHIRVRIISKDLKRGKYYLKKGEIIDVVGPTTCDISIDGELVQGVEQEMLETALPKKGGAVLVLYGKNKGVFGNLMEKDLDEEVGIVRDADSHELINVKLEQIAEFVGAPSLLDY